MKKIISINKVAALSATLKAKGKTIVLAGGCFDILHPGHMVFLEKAKKVGDILIVMLESDQKVRLLKGANRPVHNQKERAKILSALSVVDYVVQLPFMKNNSQYDQVVREINPDVVAVTAKDNNSHHLRTSELVGAKLKVVTAVIGQYSTSSLIP